jgi:predicted nucleic acid-binding protein
MLRVLVDTSVWLDLLKDYRQKPLLTVLENLLAAGEVSLVLPRIVKDEFERNKVRISKRLLAACVA